MTIEQIAHDFGVHPMTLQKWLHRAKVEEGLLPAGFAITIGGLPSRWE